MNKEKQRRSVAISPQQRTALGGSTWLFLPLLSLLASLPNLPLLLVVFGSNKRQRHTAQLVLGGLTAKAALNGRAWTR
jgi:hypothetical protein